MGSTSEAYSEKIKMKTEDWKIVYDMQARDTVVKLDETLKIKEGYHEALKRFWSEHEHREDEKDPVYKIRGGNYVELLSLGFGGGFTLPLIPRQDLEGAVLLCDSKHTIRLTAPDGTEYIHSK